MSRRSRPAALMVVLMLGGCGSTGSDGGGGATGGMIKDALINLVTFQHGSIESAKALRGTGPFREYGVPPAKMFELAESVLRSKVPAVWANHRAMELVAKEQVEGDPVDPSYGDKWSSAVVVTVHPVCGDSARSKVEIHGVRKGVFKGGNIDWEKELPPLLDAAARRGTPEPIHPFR